MAIIHFSTKNIYNNLTWDNNVSNSTSFETTEDEIPASNLTDAKDNSQHDAIVNGTIRGIALHLPLSGYFESSTYPYYSDEFDRNDVEIVDYKVAYYVNPEAIQLPIEIGESVSGRLERFDTVNQMILYLLSD